MSALYQVVDGSTDWWFVKAVSLAGLLVEPMMEEASYGTAW